jgi:TorA maturation chaperone TorD
MASAPDAEDAEANGADADERAAGADLYAVLAACWREPTAELVEAVDDGALDSVVPGVDTVSIDALRREYTRLLIGPGEMACPPYESVHRDGESEDATGPVLGPSTDAVERWYREYGLAVDPDWVEMPDHVATELEFVAYLFSTGEPAAAGQFLEEHLRVWLPEFLDDVAAATELSYYATLAETTRTVLDRPVETLGGN